MSNPMNSWNEPPKSTLSPEQGARLFFGGALLIFGMIVGGTLIYQLKQIVLGPAEPALVTRLTPASADDLAILIDGKDGPTTQTSRIQLPPKTLGVIGYFFAVIALWVVTLIAYATISGGVKLLLSANESRTSTGKRIE